MGELGAQARSYHQEVGEYVKTCKIEHLLTVGVLSRVTTDAFNQLSNTQTSLHFSSKEALVNVLNLLIEKEEKKISILVKGSRSAHMEDVVKQVITQYQQKNNKGVA